MWARSPLLRRVPSGLGASGRRRRLRRSCSSSSSSAGAAQEAPAPPLEGLRVLDLTRVLAGPFSSMILGDLGADVIKVEHPTRGDDTRHWGPPFAGASKETAYFLAVNRNKRSIGVDFKQKEGRRILQALAKESDVLLENFLPGALDRAGLGYEELKAINPRLIYCSWVCFSRGWWCMLIRICRRTQWTLTTSTEHTAPSIHHHSITGFGSDGPAATRPGYDVIIQGGRHATSQRRNLSTM